MRELDIEIGSRALKGFALAGVIEDCRVYRGNGKIDVVGVRPQSDIGQRDLSRLFQMIERGNGHAGWQGPKRKLQARNTKKETPE